MRTSLSLVVAALVLAACSEPGVSPHAPLVDAPSIQLAHLGGDPAGEDLCGGLSPCDAYDYRGDGSVGAAGMCFLPPTVDNHLSDPACSAPNTPGLSGIFQLAWCKVAYTNGTDQPPTIDNSGPSPGCQVGDYLVQDPNGGEFYASSVRWRRNEADVGDIFRVYVVRGEQAFAHRDLIIDPNLTTPSDDYVHAIGFGNEPMKVLISQDFSCIRYDTQGGDPANAATCLITDGTPPIQFTTEQVTTTFTFRDGNDPFVADFEVSECLSLGFYVDPTTGLPDVDGNALVDVPLADCWISLSSDEVDRLEVPAQVSVTLNDERWSNVPADDAPFQFARLNVLLHDELGVGALPPSEPQVWFGLATSDIGALRWLGRGLDMLADLLLPEPAYARFGSGSWEIDRMSWLQVAVMPVMTKAEALAAETCVSENPYCWDLGTFAGENPTTPISVQVSAPWSEGQTTYPDDHIPVPDARLHFFVEGGTVRCPTGSGQGPDGRGCVDAPTAPGLNTDVSTTPESRWDHLVVITGPDGIGTAELALAEGENRVRVVACGIARMGPDEADAVGDDYVWGDLHPDSCNDRYAAMSAEGYDNGPADGFTPFEPVDTRNEVAIYGRPLEFLARTCPTINIDGIKDAAWDVCADPQVFTAPQKGPKVEDNGTLYTFSDGQALYIGVEVATSELGNRIFINLTEGTATVGSIEDGNEAEGDEILLIDALGEVGQSFEDWHFTAPCVENNAASLCGAADVGDDGQYAADGDASVGGAGDGTVFYEFVRRFGSPVPLSGKEDLAAGLGDRIGLKVTVTQGQGGGKGGFVYPDPQTSDAEYHVFTIGSR